MSMGISQYAMSYHLNISQPAYSKMELGETKIDIDRLYEIADILEVSIFDLMPKSKYGTGINMFGLKNTWRRVRKFLGLNKPKDHLENENKDQ